MQGDFSRLTFDPRKQYRAVHMQQGRVQLDADWNEQVAIFNYALETQIRDLVGPAGGPQVGAGFQIISTFHADATEQQVHTPTFDFVVSRGRYYIDGILCENERDVLYTQQTDYPAAPLPPEHRHYMIAYLDVWLRHVNVIEDPALREIALGGIDTTTRTKTVWQAKMLPVGQHRVLADSANVTYEQVVDLAEWHALLNRQKHKGHLQARLVQQNAAVENQLYRVEIHDVQEEAVTFKWSRENGSVVFEVQQFRQNEAGDVLLTVNAEELGRDRTRLQKGDWVEFVDEETLLQGHVLPLYQVKEVPDYAQGRVTLKGVLSDELGQRKWRNLYLRRWDHDVTDRHASALLRVREGREQWIGLEYGLQVAFQPGGSYATGDYWLLPARALSQNIEWPEDPVQQGVPLALPPRGIDHHYCPLALLARNQDGNWEVASDLRRIFAPLPVVSALAERPPVSVTEIAEEVTLVERSRTLVELCSSDEDLAPGDLVSLVPGSDVRITRASRENAPMVFGVVAGIREQAGEERFLVTIYGRVRCSITGSITAGDLLAVSEKTAGCAAKVEQADRLFRPGSILGKALDTYEADGEDSVGRITILVALQ